MKRLFMLSLVIATIWGCKSDNTSGEVAENVILKQITLERDDDNYLRMKVHVQCHKPASIEVEYFAVDDPSNVLVSHLSEASIDPTATLLFLEENTKYRFRIKASTDNSWTVSAQREFTSAKLPAWMPKYTLEKDELTSVPNGYIHIAQKEGDGYLLLLNYKGKIVWYEKLGIGINVSRFDPATASFYCIVGNNPERIFAGREIIIVDLYGNIRLRRVNSSFENPYFHHDIKPLPDGGFAVVNFVGREFDLTAQGGPANQLVWGDGFTTYNAKGEKVSAWDVFSEINPADDPDIMGKTDFGNMNKVDIWVGANNIDLDTDGNYLMSFNISSEMWKIDKATGKVIFRFGANGNVVPDNAQYCQGIHSAHRAPSGDLLFLDNGRVDKQTRALSYSIDEKNRTAHLTHDVKLDKQYFSAVQGSVYLLPGDNFMFGPSMSQHIIITDAKGTDKWVLKTPHIYFRAYPIDPIKL